MRNLRVTMLLLITLLVCGAVVHAAPPKDRRSGWPPPDLDKVLDHFDMVTMLKMMEALDLDKATGEKVFSIRRKFVAEKKAIMKELGNELEALRARLQDERFTRDEGQLRTIVDSIRNKRRRLENLRDQQYDEISHVLTVLQQAQLLIFMKDFQDEIRAFIDRPIPPHLGPPPPFGGPPGPPPGGIDPFVGATDFSSPE